VPPARSSAVFAQGIDAGRPRRVSGSVLESPVRRKPHAHEQKNPLRLESEDLDFLARVRLRVIDPDLKHGKALLQLFSTRPCAGSGCKFGLPSGVVKPLGKAPVDPKWTTIKVVSRAVRRRCLAELRNMGIRLKPTQLVIDIDPRNGGNRGFQDLCFRIGLNDEEWPCVITGSGGRHYYLLLPDGFSVVEMLDEYPGVEFKSGGRQVVAAGSKHPNGKFYKWSRKHPDIRKGIPLAPTNLLNTIRRPCRGHNSASEGGQYTPEQLEAMLARLDVLDFQDEPKWRQLMFACHHATNGDGEAEFVAWSAGDPNFAGDSASVVKRWRSCREKTNAITYLTLHYILREHGARDAIPAPDCAYDFDDIEDIEADRFTRVRDIQP
jgi:hypothetical protein